MLSTPFDRLFQGSATPSYEDIIALFSSLSREELLHHLYDSLLTYSEWKRIVDLSNDGIYIADATGMGIYINDAYKEISGLTQEEIYNVTPDDLVRRHYIDRSCIALVREKKRAFTIESHFYRTSKQTLVTCKPILDKAGEIIFMIGSIRDMTEINRLREQGTKDKALITRFKSEIEKLKAQFLQDDTMVAEDPVSLNVLCAANRVAPADSPILLTGETGVGKEEMARFIHTNSPRHSGPFIRVNCSTIAESLFESELFGYDRGAFTGAKNEGKQGLFEVADGGTLFLDEIGEMPLTMQPKLLRVLQDKEIIKVGSAKPTKVDVRIIAATNRDLAQMVREKTFRADLYYRLNVIPLHIPPLRERRGDILPLVELFRNQLNQKYDYDKHFSSAALSLLQQYDWPGNIRELRNIVERAIIFSGEGEIGLSELGAIHFWTSQDIEGSSWFDLDTHLKRVEYKYMRAAYQRCGTMKEAAAAVGMKKSTFAGKFKAYHERFGSSVPDGIE